MRRIACFFNEASRADVSVALRTMALLAERHPDVRLTLLGPLDRREALRLQSAALGIVGHVDTPRADATAETDRATLAGAELGWVLSRRDDAMFATLDCFAAGLPVVVERNPLSGRLVKDGEDRRARWPTSRRTSPRCLRRSFPTVRDGNVCAGCPRRGVGVADRAMADGFIRAIATARDRTRWRT